MFVTREPASARSPGSDATSAPPERPNLDAEDPPGVKDALDIPYPPNGEIEEAEVTIVTAEVIQERQQTAHRDGNLRRFRKALLGE